MLKLQGKSIASAVESLEALARRPPREPEYYASKDELLSNLLDWDFLQHIGASWIITMLLMRRFRRSYIKKGGRMDPGLAAVLTAFGITTVKEFLDFAGNQPISDLTELETYVNFGKYLVGPVANALGGEGRKSWSNAHQFEMYFDIIGSGIGITGGIATDELCEKHGVYEKMHSMYGRLKAWCVSKLNRTNRLEQLTSTNGELYESEIDPSRERPLL